jgi:6-phosphogluconolactonase (cycloisomerase 2 family)
MYDTVISPDGLNLYGIEYQTNLLAVFDLTDPPGAFALSQTIYDSSGGVNGLLGPTRLTISPAGDTVYVSGSADDAVSVFSRNDVTGELTFVEAHFNGAGDITGLDNPSELAVSADGQSLYVIGLDAASLVVFDRDPVLGELTYRETHVDGAGGVTNLGLPQSLAVSSDGASVYVVADASICVFSRDQATGALTFSEAVLETGSGGPGLRRPTAIDITADDRVVIVLGERTLAVFNRDPSTGSLSLLETHFSNDAGVPNIGYPNGLLVSPMNDDVYYGGMHEIVGFSWRLLGDGFESGDTSAWDSSSP